jgi:hypothetical protein
MLSLRRTRRADDPAEWPAFDLSETQLGEDRFGGRADNTQAGGAFYTALNTFALLAQPTERADPAPKTAGTPRAFLTV